MYQLTKIKESSLNSWISQLKEFQLDNFFDTGILGRAYLLIDDIRIDKNSENAIEATVKDKGYFIKIQKEEDEITGSCTCPYNDKCKHMAATLLSMMAHRLNF